MSFSKKALQRALFVLFFITGCASKLEPILSRPDEVKPPEEERVLTDLPVLQLEEKPKKPKPERLYTLSVRNASVKDVLLSFSKESKVNIIVDPDVSGEVTADLKDVTLVQALDALLTPLGSEYAYEAGFVRVSRQKLITRLFHLNYIGTFRQAFRTLASSTSSGVAGGGIGGAAGAAGGGVTGGAAGAAGGVTGGAAGGGGGGSSGFNTVTGSDIQDIFREIELGMVSLGLRSTGMLQAGLAAGGGAAATTTAGAAGGGGALPMGAKGLFSINRQAGIVMITAFPDTVAKAAELLETVEGTIQRQVLIEAKIVEVTLRDAFRFGINWETIFFTAARNPLSFSKGLTEAERTLLSFPLSQRNKDRPGLSKDISRVEGITQFAIGSKEMEAILEALTRQGEVNVISSPKVSTLNNQTAIIRVGTQETFFAGVVQRQTTGGVVTTTEGVTQNPVTIGVTLDVTPQIGPSGIITMNIHPSITDKTGITKSRFGDEAPILDIREMDTVIRVKDGETIVLGGLMQEKKEVTEDRAPVVGKIPLIGWLFKDVTRDKRKTDLVIFLTPTVLLGERVEDLSAEEMERLELIRGRR